MQNFKILKYFSIFLKCLASSDDVCINITDGTKGTIKSIDREYVTCPAWYQVWKGFEKCYPAKDFNWCWQLRPNCSKVKVRFTKFAVEEQSRALHNYHNLKKGDVCIDRVELRINQGYYLFCDESHQNQQEITSTENPQFDPFLTGWFDWKELDTSNIDLVFQSRELGGAGSSNFAGFDLEWECTHFDECLLGTHDCSPNQKCVDFVHGYECMDLETISIPSLNTLEALQSDTARSMMKNSTDENSEAKSGSIRAENDDTNIDRTFTFGAEVANLCDACDPNAECINNKCKCKDGFSGSGYMCVAMFGECHEINKLKCDKNAKCIDKLGTDDFECTCLPGFSGDGFTCQSNELAKTNDSCNNSCNENATCVDGECQCKPGYVGNGKVCLPGGLFTEIKPTVVLTTNEVTTEYAMKDGKCSVAKIEEGNCDSAFKAAFDFVFCIDSFKTEDAKQQLKTRSLELKQFFCTLYNVRGEKKTCIDRGTPYFSNVNKIQSAGSFDDVASGLLDVIQSRFRYCRRHQHYSRRFQRFSKSYRKNQI